MHHENGSMSEQKQIDFSDKNSANSILKELSADDFIRLVDDASPEELQSLLIAVDKPAPRQTRQTPKLFDTLTRPLEYKPRSFVDVIAWWESRRFAYNVIVGLTGLCVLAVLRQIQFASMGSLVEASIAYGIAANICYTSGWMADLFARRFWKEKAEHFAPILFTLGLMFSVGLTVVPGVLAIIVFVLTKFLPVGVI
jgi:hypothetical protein